MNASVGSFSPRHYHRKFRNPLSSYRRRRYKTPGTPQLSWKFDERQRACGGVEVSARKLAAGFWQLRLLAEASDCGVKYGSCDRFRFQPDAGHVNTVLFSHCTSRGYGVGKDLPGSPLPGHGLSPKILHKHKSFLAQPNLVMEGVTKWDTGCSKTSTKFEDQVTTFSIISSLQAKLVKARLKIRELEDEKRSSKKKFENLMRNLRDERKLWYSRTHHKMKAIINDLKNKLIKEKKRWKQISFLYSQFIDELAKAESQAKQFMQDYEEEKRARELLEKVCNELAKGIGEHKVELEMLMGETRRIRKEVEEERNMLQLAEIWREERVQMKLVDAKLALERKYSQMNKLVEDLESFLMSSEAALDVTALRKVDFMRQAIKSVNIQECEEFEYVPPESDSILSSYEEIRTAINEREMEVERLTNYSSIWDQIASGQVKDFDSNHVINHSNVLFACNNGFEEDFGAWKSARHAEDHGSRCSIEGSNHSLSSINQGKVASKSIVIYDGNAGQHSPNTDISGLRSITGEQLRQKACSVSQLRSDEGDGRVSKGTCMGTMRKSVDGGCSQWDSTGQFVSSSYLGNPHITREMKGSMEWPRVTRKANLKGKLVKSMMENQRTHLRKVLK